MVLVCTSNRDRDLQGMTRCRCNYGRYRIRRLIRWRPSYILGNIYLCDSILPASLRVIPMRLTIAFFVAALLAGSAAAQTSYPMITHVTPVAVQRGKTTEITVEGQMNFFGAYKALFEGERRQRRMVTPPRSGPLPVQRRWCAASS